MSDMVLALTTVPVDFDPVPLAQELVAAGLAACVTILPTVQSVYTWKGVPQVGQEKQLFIKTTTEQVDALWDVVRDKHPYDVPEFLVLPVVDGSSDYMRWVEESVGPKAES
jgi:periplasmic divalent cation tolerance protein